MHRKHRNTLRNITLATAGAALASVALLWSWNTLVPLFGGPTFQFRHALAVLIALVVLRLGLRFGRGHRRRSTQSEIHS